MQIDVSKLKNIMNKKKVNVTILSEIASVDKATISRLLNGKSTCSINTAHSIAKALNLSSKDATSIFFANTVALSQQNKKKNQVKVK